MAQKQATRNSITLKGSTQIVTEFFNFAINSILYHRGIYPADDFHTVKKYGQPVLLTEDPNLEAYLSNILKQVEKWLMNKKINKLVLVVLNAASRVVLERWEFDIHITKPEIGEDGSVPAKPEKEIRAEIRAILKQIVGSNAYMPTLSDPCIFDILAYTEENAEVPVEEWRDTHGHLIEAGKTQTVKLKSFDTSLHRIDAMVAYRYEG
ncbi:mitotic spindle checkpoint protein MAD2 [Cantharellus anzutake]|uniref:mitotic spindle checkpoint protein MAD2 n=1 Tax=Cantharellus anzutake TaxID=1750568 RepID=UPI001906117C|nr:mitotic spindle checkpoint protein MAD2 [Cantharellus anzutake]KAF8337525.1 mitotic spindle checkpoint protein MAD2 [Cantharellus anzutake]